MSRRLAVLLTLMPAGAAATVAAPATIADVIDHARAGDTIRLMPGTYAPIKLRDYHWAAPVTVDATAATLRSVRLDSVSGLTWHGGTFDGGDTTGDGFKVEQSDHLIVDGATFRHFTRVGIILGRTTDARLTGNVFTDSGSDGIDVALSQRVVIDHNRCTDFHPQPGAHPDCVQLWSKPGYDPVADVTITNNVAIGDMQGFTAFDGPYDRITIEHNFARVTAWHGIALYDCRQCAVRHNRVESLPNVSQPDARAWIRVQGGKNISNCENLAVDYRDDAGRKKCRDN